MEYPPETAIKSQFLVALDDTFQYLANSKTSNSVRVNGFKMILSYIHIIEGSLSNCHLHNTIDNPSFAPEIDSIKSRSEERRVGKECVSTCRSRWSTNH